ncbi:thymidylate synthase (FAD) [Dehalogenimonas formicexedens]|uniref:Flavin-dependent thymidylate synthase n=1 Tax=Dehalogenimonas formicexedens TaxID=1839801 RepID=A0A1P8F5K1_9CHLR|nr:FAD-dependent thymidylate synthase [Dehalogenimonas formicexedens]APV43764.1 thymidylate synthase (FAD) [Dehalogenimonas formicexedens]
MEYEIAVTLLAITPDAESLTEQAGRLCYASGDKLGTKEGWLQARIKQGHESLIEHASATFYIKASRALTHELVRHRIASYSQRSQRYVKESVADYITPPEAAGDDVIARVYKESMEASWKAYGELLQAGVKPEIARYVLPNACSTEIICTWNFREIRHIIRLRTGPAALPEMRAVVAKIREIMREKAPGVFGDM